MPSPIPRPPPATIQITQLPQTYSAAVLPVILEKYKSFRLQSLQIAPHSFAMTYEQELAFPEVRWRERLLNPDAVHFVATRSIEAEIEAWEGEWVGSAVLVRLAGRRNDFDDGKFVNRDGAGGKELRFHLNAVFVVPDARGQGLAGRLLDAGLDYVRDEAVHKHASRVKVTTLADTVNEVAIGVYAKMGFVRKQVDWYTVGEERREAVELELIMDIEQAGRPFA